MLRSIKWDEHFLRMALLTSAMSKDPSTRVGAVIVGPDLEVRSTGFNGFPRNIRDTEERLRDRETKYKLVIHAEVNAILHAARIGVSVKDCTLYIAAQDAVNNSVWGGPPCSRCVLDVVQVGITTIVSYPFKNVPSRWSDSLQDSMKLIDEAKLKYIECSL